MTTKHTPGPWTIEIPSNGCDRYIIHGKSFEEICATCLDTEHEMQANARLIAAAPELLEACRLALGAFEANRIDMQQNAERKLNAAIAKAEGK